MFKKLIGKEKIENLIFGQIYGFSKLSVSESRYIASKCMKALESEGWLDE